MSHTSGVSLVHFLAVPPVSSLIATDAPTPPITAGFVTAAPWNFGFSVDQLLEELVVVGSDDRDVRLACRLERVHDGVVDPRRPDSVDLHAGVEDVEHLLAARCERPAGEGLLHDLDLRIVLQRLLEALVPVGVGRDAGDAAHLDHVALAADLLEQPDRAEPAVRDLVVGDVVGLRRGDCWSTDDDLTPRAAACATTALSALALDGLMMIAFAPAEIRLRMSAICSAGPPLRFATLTSETCRSRAPAP